MSRRIIVAMTTIVCILSLTGIVYVFVHPIPIVLMFHAVVEHPQGLDVSPEAFRLILSSVRAGSHRVVVTTDSSDKSMYQIFAPELQKEGLTATVFLMPPVIGRDGMLTWNEVRELDRAGFTIGSHTMTHPWLPDLSDDELRIELCASKERLEREIGHDVTALAYPYGAFDERVKQAAQRCRYSRAYTTAPGRRIGDEDVLAIKRVTMSHRMASNPFLRWLGLSGWWVTARETLLVFVPVDVPRRAHDWSYENWRKQ